MMRLAVAALVLTGLAAPTALATPPKWTAKGAVTTLRLHSITVHGTTCRLTTASPPRSTMRLYYVGAAAKIACAHGILRAIETVPLPPVIVTAPLPGASATRTTTTNGPLSFETVGGNFAITALGTSITVGGGSLMVTCTVGDGSPDVSGFQVGDRLSRMECRNSVLTSITRRSAS
jgi:hypothetical protein